MAWRHWPTLKNILWLLLAWAVLLALLPWWLGLPLLFALVAVLLLLSQRLAEHAPQIRRGLRCGLPGVLFALQRALGGDAFAWGAALLGALAGYTLLAGLEAWLDRGPRHAAAASSSAEWPELALAPIRPAADIIELQPPEWQSGDEAGLIDPRGGITTYFPADGYRFADGHGIAGVGPHATFSPAARWFAARMEHDHGVVLWDRERDRQYRVRGWQLCGWYREQPWLLRREGEMPLALPAVLGYDDEE